MIHKHELENSPSESITAALVMGISLFQASHTVKDATFTVVMGAKYLATTLKTQLGRLTFGFMSKGMERS